MALFNSLFYVDSKAVLCSLNSTDMSGIHCLLVKGTGVTFCWRGITGFQARSKDQEILEEGGGAGPSHLPRRDHE